MSVRRANQFQQYLYTEDDLVETGLYLSRIFVNPIKH